MVLRGASRNAVDPWEFARFIGTGITATLGNLGAVWISGHYVTYGFSLAVGILAGFILSFSLSKLVAFKSPSWRHAPGEMVRFLIVFATGALIYWIVGFIVGHYVLPTYLDRQKAELGGAVIGASIMTLTSYFGHRFFTYNTFSTTADS